MVLYLNIETHSVTVLIMIIDLFLVYTIICGKKMRNCLYEYEMKKITNMFMELYFVGLDVMHGAEDFLFEHWTKMRAAELACLGMYHHILYH